MIYCHLHFIGVEREANRLTDTINLVQQPLCNVSRLVFARTYEVGYYNPYFDAQRVLHITWS